MFIQEETDALSAPLDQVLARFPNRWPSDAVALAQLYATAVSEDESWVDWLDEASGQTRHEPEPDAWTATEARVEVRQRHRHQASPETQAGPTPPHPAAQATDLVCQPNQPPTPMTLLPASSLLFLVLSRCSNPLARDSAVAG